MRTRTLTSVDSAFLPEDAVARLARPEASGHFANKTESIHGSLCYFAVRGEPKEDGILGQG